MKITMLMITVILLSSCSTSTKCAHNKVKGNGKIVTKEIRISDYHSIQIGSGIVCQGNSGKKGIPAFHYNQSNRKTSLKITTDENILSLLEIETSKGILSIRAKEGVRQLLPTRFSIDSRSKELSGLTVSGCIDFYADNELRGDELRIKVSGASDVYLQESVRMKSCTFAVSGSGNISAKDLDTRSIECRVSGSGDVALQGTAREGVYRVSGSGDIHAYNFVVDDLDCSVSGSGDVRAYAEKTLKARVSGSGEIQYKGDPRVDKRTSGSGTIRRSR